MSKDDASNPQRIVPMIAYEDGVAAIDWLVRAFGFRELARMTGDDGRISHAELELGGGTIMLASPTPDYQSPRRHREGCEPARKWSALPWVIDGVMVQVGDADAHFRQASAAGATILSEPEDQPYGRAYRAEDLEGHRWMFMQPAAAAPE